MDLNEFDATFSSITLHGGRMNEMQMGLSAKPLSKQEFRRIFLKSGESVFSVHCFDNHLDGPCEFLKGLRSNVGCGQVKSIREIINVTRDCDARPV